MKISHINKEKTVRVQKFFEDSDGQYRYRLEKWIPGPTLFGVTIFKGVWRSGKGGIGGFSVSTTYKKKLDAWIEHYKLEEVKDEMV
jgi:hypothetical protein